MTTPATIRGVERIARLEPLDEPAAAVGKSVRDAIPTGPVKDALSGTWLGHALHPLLTDLPIGTWTSAVRSRTAARTAAGRSTRVRSTMAA